MQTVLLPELKIIHDETSFLCSETKGNVFIEEMSEGVQKSRLLV